MKTQLKKLRPLMLALLGLALVLSLMPEHSGGQPKPQAQAQTQTQTGDITLIAQK